MNFETAQEKAEREGLVQVPVVPAELMGVALDGRPIIVRALDGQEVLLRVPTDGMLANRKDNAVFLAAVSMLLSRAQTGIGRLR